jgi:hypothetical protein
MVLPWITSLLISIWFIETTAPNDGSQIIIEKIESKKKIPGTTITLLVLARKSAAASMQSIAVFNAEYLQ